MYVTMTLKRTRSTQVLNGVLTFWSKSRVSSSGAKSMSFFFSPSGAARLTEGFSNDLTTVAQCVTNQLCSPLFLLSPVGTSLQHNALWMISESCLASVAAYTSPFDVLVLVDGFCAPYDRVYSSLPFCVRLSTFNLIPFCGKGISTKQSSDERRVD